ncbi:MAG: magnesium/cobalt transporter CorA [Desulfobacteraceae bacterium]
MPRFIFKSRKLAGSPPGTLVHVGEAKTERVLVTMIQYTADNVEKADVLQIEDLCPPGTPDVQIWIDMVGIHDASKVEALGNQFTIHPLTQEDILNTGHRPKAEEFDDYLYIVFKMLQYDEADHSILSEQVSMVLGAGFLITFQEAPGDVFTPVRDRLAKGKGRIRKSGTDYLAYALIDAAVDQYFHIMEKMGERIEVLEEELTEYPEADVLEHIHNLKREAIYLRKQIWPMRDMLSRLTKGEFDLIREENLIYFSDVYDHIVQLIDTNESYRDVLTGMLDLYLSTVSYRMNQVMKVLTIVATIFIPITFIAGIYGMNFKYMPELEWPWGYGAVWCVMMAIAVIMLFIFKKNKWL